MFLAARYQSHVYVRWIDAVIAKAQELHGKRKFDIVYSRSVPEIAHFAGFWCSKRLRLPWVVSMNDPWLVPQRKLGPSLLGGTVYSQWLRRTLKHANATIYPTERLHHYQNRLLNINKPATIIPHVGYAVRSHREDKQPIFRIVHAGKLGSNEKPDRSTGALLNGFRNFLIEYPEARPRTKLILVGPEDPDTTMRVSELGLADVVEAVGIVSYEQSLRYVSEAAVCLLVEADLSEGIFLPSKLIDYLAAKKPVLALSPRVGVIADFATHGGITRVDSSDEQGIHDGIGKLYSEFIKGSLQLRITDETFVKQFAPELIAAKFVSLIDHLDGTITARQREIFA